jgi:hypothetical protein
MHCDYLFEFQINRRISESLLLQNLPRNAFDVEDNEYKKTLVFAYNKKLGSLISASCITRSLEEEESSPPHIGDAVTNLEEEMMNMEDTTPMATPQFAIGSNELNNPPMEPDLAQYVKKRVW